MFLTVALPFSELKLRPVTLLPLRVGTLIAPQIASRLAAPHGRRVALKWPNDVLIGEDKVSGVLIEMDGDDLLVGIGVNLRYAPDVPTSGADRGAERRRCRRTARTRPTARRRRSHMRSRADRDVGTR